MNNIKLILISCLLISTLCQHKSEQEILDTVASQIITYGSVVRIQNVMTKFK